MKLKINFSIIVSLISLLFIWSSIANYYEKPKTIQNEEIKNTPIGTIIPGKSFYQKLDLGSNIAINQIEILLATWDRNNTSKVKFIFNKGNQHKEFIEDTREILDNSFKKFELNFKKNDSPLEIKIEAVNGGEGNSITAWGTTDLSLGELTLNNNGMNISFIVKMEITEAIKYSETNIIFFAVTIIMFLVLYFIIDKKNKFMYISFVLSYTLLTIKFPTNSFASEIWAEQGTNFFINATTKTFVENIKSLDYVYLPLAQRLISLFFIKMLGIKENFVVILNIVSLGLMSFFFSSLNFKIFNDFGLNKISRFIISIYFIVFFEVGYDNATFINFIYWGILPCFLFLFIDFEKIKQKELSLITLLTILFMLSKGCFVAFLPLYFLLLIKNTILKENKERIYVALSFLAGFIQFLIMRNYSPKQIINIKELIFMLKDLYYKTFLLFIQNNKIFAVSSETSIQLALFIGFSILVIYSLYKQNKKSLYQVFFYSNAIIIGNLSIVIIANNYNYDTISFTRALIISNVIMFFYVIYFIAILMHQLILLVNLDLKKSSGYISIFLIIVLFNSYYLNREKGEFYPNYQDSHSDWEEYKKLINNPSYIIPINPMVKFGWWSMSKNIGPLYNEIYTKEGCNNLNRLNINSIIIEKKQGDNFSISFFDKSNNIILETNQMNSKFKGYSYFLINKQNLDSFILKKNGSIVEENYKMIIYTNGDE